MKVHKGELTSFGIVTWVVWISPEPKSPPWFPPWFPEGKKFYIHKLVADKLIYSKFSPVFCLK